MRYYGSDVVLADVPDEISLTFSIVGCRLNCSACFWQELRSAPTYELDDELFTDTIQRYRGLVSCVLFYGGEWHPLELIRKLKLAHQLGFKTCLYTGLSRVKDSILKHLDYLKTGTYQEKLGGLSSPTTNQKFINVNSGEDLTAQFWQLAKEKRK